MFKKFLQKKKNKDEEIKEKKIVPAIPKKEKPPERKIVPKKVKSKEEKAKPEPVKKVAMPIKKIAEPVKKVIKETEEEKFEGIKILESNTRILTAEGWKRRKLIKK